MDMTYEALLPHEKITLRTYCAKLQGITPDDLTLFLLVQDIFEKYPDLSVYDVPTE